MMKFHLFKSPARTITGLILLLCCLNTGAARAQCAIGGGNDSLCIGTTDTLSSACSGGMWSSLNPSIATVNSSGIVTGLSGGSAIIRYLVSGVPYSTSVTVVPPPNAGTITGARGLCASSTTTLTNAVTGGTWSTSSALIASVNTTGTIRSGTTGTATITYTVTNYCGSASDTQLISVQSLPPNPISSFGNGAFCQTDSVTTTYVLGPMPPADCIGIWSTSGAFSATISVGTAGSYAQATLHTNPYCGYPAANTVTYKFRNFCGDSPTPMTRTVTLYPHNNITNYKQFMCPGSSYIFNNCANGGRWHSSADTIATVDSITGNVTAIAAGTVIISCTSNNPICPNTVSKVVKVGAPDSMRMASPICAGTGVSAALYPFSYYGGTWSTASAAIASVSATGTGFVLGSFVATRDSTRISYTCGSVLVYDSITVKPSPIIGDIQPGFGYNVILCPATTDSLWDTTAGGTWSSSNPSMATVSTTGVVTGVSPGFPTIFYTKTLSGCSANKSKNISVFGAPNPGTITGAPSLCIGASATYIDTFFHSAGSWSCSPTTVATINPTTHVLYALAAGTVTVSYTTTPGTALGSCPDRSALYTVTVNPPPPPITGADSFCRSSITILYNALGGGLWSSSDPTVANIDSTGLVTSTMTGTVPQTAIIYYTVSTSCGTATVSDTVTVFPNPVISGAATICQGMTTLLTASIAGGVWGSHDTLSAPVSASGVVTGSLPATTYIYYSIPATGCGTTFPFTVNATPVIGIGLNGNPPAPFPAVLCGNRINLTAYGALTYTWAMDTYLYLPGTSTPYILGSFANSLDVHAFSLPILTYTITGTSSAGCVGTTTYSVVQPTCDAAFCTPFSGTPVYSLRGNIGSAGTATYMPSGNYNVADTTKFLGTVHFNGNVLAIAPNVPVFVDTSAELYIDSSHLYCCDKIRLWNGITLSAGATTSGKLTLTHHCLIEDSKTAIKIYNGIIPATGYTLVSVGCIYNRNRIAIDVNQYPAVGSPQPTPPYNYPFLVYDNVFTSRDLTQFVPTSGYGWPMQYPATSGTSTALKAPYTPVATYASFMPHYNIINPNGAGAAGVGYPYQALNDGTIANLGIRLVNVGSYATDTARNQPATYNGITIGEDVLLGGNSGINLFDTLCEGIYALSSNLTCYNNTFMYMYRPSTLVPNPTGEGVTAVTGAVVLPTGVTAYPKYNLKIAGSATPTNNQFFDCIRGASSQQYYNVDIENASVISYPSPTATMRGQGGFAVLSRRYHDVTMKNNEITNVLSGLTLNSGIGGGYINQFSGNIDISGNTVNSNVGGAIPVSGSGMQVMNSISLNNMFLAGTGSNIYYTGSAFVNNNTMNYVQNGIAVNGYHFGQPVWSNDNYVRMVNRTGSSTPQNGIFHKNCIGNFINNNTITGPGYNVPVATSDTTKAGKITGIYGGNNYNANITCNYTGHTNVGFQLQGSGNLTNWLNNEMDKNTFGLAAKGSFGDQGNPVMPCNDVWHNALPWWTGGNRNILTMNGFAPPDTLFVSNNPSGTPTDYYDPLNNVNNPFSITRSYGFMTTGVGNGLDTVSTPASLPSCLLAYSMYARAAHVATGPFVEAAPQNWIAQYSVWQSIVLDNNLRDSSAVLNQFAVMAADSRYGWLTTIASSIMGGDKTTASSLLSDGIHAHLNTATDATTGVTMMDGEDADYIVENYITLYGEYLKYMDSTMNGDDSLQVIAIANLCPYSYGNVVYDAQALYRILYEDDTTVFEGNCGGSPAPRKAQEGFSDTKQGYELFPNPNDGSFMLRQLTVDATPTAVAVKDVLGRTVFTQSVQFSGGTAQLQTGNLTSGVYLLQITDSSKKISTFKFVIQK